MSEWARISTAPEPGYKRGVEGEKKVQAQEDARIQQNAKAAARGEPQKGGAAGREAIASQDPKGAIYSATHRPSFHPSNAILIDVDTRGGHAGGVEPQKDPLI